MIHIENTRRPDLNCITKIYSHAVINGTATYETDPPNHLEMAARYNTLIKADLPYLTAKDDDGEVLGFAYASRFRTRPAYRWSIESSIYIAPNAQRMGVGKLLLEALIKRCIELEFRQIIAVIGGAHPASIALHQTLGFEEKGCLSGTGFKNGTWLDTTIMMLAINSGTNTPPDENSFPASLI